MSLLLDWRKYTDFWFCHFRSVQVHRKRILSRLPNAFACLFLLVIEYVWKLLVNFEIFITSHFILVGCDNLSTSVFYVVIKSQHQRLKSLYLSHQIVDFSSQGLCCLMVRTNLLNNEVNSSLSHILLLSDHSGCLQVLLNLVFNCCHVFSGYPKHLFEFFFKLCLFSTDNLVIALNFSENTLKIYFSSNFKSFLAFSRFFARELGVSRISLTQHYSFWHSSSNLLMSLLS